MLNIGGDKNDESYRYKMPPLQCQVVGRGNGIKTSFLNIADVAKALHTPPEYIVKFFGFELGTQSSYDEPTAKGLVNGKHDFGDLQQLLEKFIALFVLCPKCGLPEINLAVKKGDLLRISCAACGEKRALKTSHKLQHYIISHPPPKKTASSAHKNADKERAKREEQLADGSVAVPETVTTEREITFVSDTSLEAQRARLQRDIGLPTEEEQARQAKIAAIIAAAKEINAEKAPSTLLQIYLAQSQRSINEIYNEIRRLQLSCGLDEVNKMKLILEVFIQTDKPLKVILQDFENPRTLQLLQKSINNEKQSSMWLINCLENLCAVMFHDKLLPAFPLILKSLYENDVLSEDAILTWYDSAVDASWLVSIDVGRATREKALPLVEWLRDDDEDEEDEDEETQ